LRPLLLVSLAVACLAPVPTTAATTLYAPEARIEIFAERAGEPHPKKLQMAFAVTEQFAGPNGQPLPIHFDIGYSHGWVGTDNPLAERRSCGAASAKERWGQTGPDRPSSSSAMPSRARWNPVTS
jgi:hypothetical protein